MGIENVADLNDMFIQMMNTVAEKRLPDLSISSHKKCKVLGEVAIGGLWSDLLPILMGKSG